MNNLNVNIKINTGAEINVLQISLCKKFKFKPENCNLNIEMLGGLNL